MYIYFKVEKLYILKTPFNTKHFFEFTARLLGRIGGYDLILLPRRSSYALLHLSIHRIEENKIEEEKRKRAKSVMAPVDSMIEGYICQLYE